MQCAGDQIDTEAEPQLSNRRLSTVLDSVSDGFFALNAGWQIDFVNRAAEMAFAVDRDEAIGRVIWDVLPTLAGTDFELRLRRVAEGRETDRFEFDYLARTYAINAAPDDGSGVSMAFSDITVQRSAEIECRLLVNELNHRVKNTLAVVQSLAVQSFRSQDSVDAARQAFDRRLATLAGVHKLLTARNWQSASLGDLVEAAIASGADRARFSIIGPVISLAPQTVVSFALALQELCANAVKHGALRSPQGRVTIRWAVALDGDGTERLHFIWTETGGPPVFPPATRGFGTRLVERAFTGDLRGRVELDFAPEGLRCMLDIPIPNGF